MKARVFVDTLGTFGETIKSGLGLRTRGAFHPKQGKWENSTEKKNECFVQNIHFSRGGEDVKVKRRTRLFTTLDLLPTVLCEGRGRQQVLQDLAILLKGTLHLLPGHELTHLFGQFPEFLKQDRAFS